MIKCRTKSKTPHLRNPGLWHAIKSVSFLQNLWENGRIRQGKLAVLEVATGQPTHLGIKDVGSRWQDNAILPRHAMRDSIFSCILEPMKKSPKPIAVRITLCVDVGSSQLSGGSVAPLGGTARVWRMWWSPRGRGWEVWVSRYGSALGMALAAAATPPRASSPETSRKLDCGLFPPQRPAASYAKSRTTSAASRSFSPRLHPVSLTRWNSPADTCLSRRCAVHLPF